MEKAVRSLRADLQKVRTGRASAALLDGIQVDYYGTPTPLSQVASISIPEPRSLMIKPFDASILKEVEKAILKSDMGAPPQNDGKVVRVSLPPLSGEQRTKFAAKAKELGEEARVLATGGLAHLIADQTRTIERVEPFLTLDGLRILFERNKSG